MRLENEFVVPRPVDQAWAVLTDVERIAPCMPGARLTEVVDDDYHGTVRVKVGPVVAQYAGVARFKERDDAAHHAVLEAKGKEKAGRGLASALVTADLIDEGGSTRVKVNTDLTISGPLAQFGRGAIVEISGRLLTEFVANLKATVLAGEPTAAPPPPTPTSAPTTTATAATAAAAAGAPTVLPPLEPIGPNRGAANATTPGEGAPDGGTPGEGAPAPATTAPVGAPEQTAITAPHNNVPPAPASAQTRRRVIDSPEAPPANLTRLAGATLLKRLIPAAAAIAVIILVLLWLT